MGEMRETILPCPSYSSHSLLPTPLLATDAINRVSTHSPLATPLLPGRDTHLLSKHPQLRQSH